MKVDVSHHVVGKAETIPHSCFERSKVIECDNKNDIRQCQVCGKEWVTRCNFDDDFA